MNFFSLKTIDVTTGGVISKIIFFHFGNGFQLSVNSTTVYQSVCRVETTLINNSNEYVVTTFLQVITLGVMFHLLIPILLYARSQGKNVDT